jgi:hypothetical protein
MPMQSLQAASSLLREMKAITPEVTAGSAVAAARNPVARGSFCRPVRQTSIANRRMKAKTDIAGKEIGIPPQTRVRMMDEYSLIMVVLQSDLPASVLLRPGVNEQLTLCSWRSRCRAKSAVEKLAKNRPSAAPARIRMV